MYNHNDCTFITFSFLFLSFLQYSSAVKQISKRILEEQNTGILVLDQKMNSSTAQFESNRTFSSSSLDYGRLALMLGDFSVALTASVANSLLLLIIYKDPHRNLRSPSTNLVINMAVADFLTGFLSGFLVTAYDGLLFMGRTARSLERYLLVNIVVAVVSVMVGCCNVVAMACDRLLAVTAALNYRTIVTVRRVNSLIVLFWIYAIGFVGLSFFRAIPKGVYELLYCHLHVSLPLIVLPLLYWKTFRALEAHSRRMTNLGPGNQRMTSKTVCTERKTTKAFAIVLCLFYVSFLPYVVVVKRVSMGLTVRRKTAKNLAVRRKNERILAVSRKKN